MALTKQGRLLCLVWHGIGANIGIEDFPEVKAKGIDI
jgi:hypothetical protein